jgi:hypothetical protein
LSRGRYDSTLFAEKLIIPNVEERYSRVAIVPFPEGYLEIGFGIFDPGNFFPDLSTYGSPNWPNWGADARVRDKSMHLLFKIGAFYGSYLGKNLQDLIFWP